MYAWTESQNSFQWIQTVKMFSKATSWAKSCKVMIVLVGADHPAFMRSLEDRHGPQQSPEQKLQRRCQQRVLLPGCLQDSSTQQAGPLSAPQGDGGRSRDISDACKLTQWQMCMDSSTPNPVSSTLPLCTLVSPSACTACAACRDHACQI